MFRLPASARPEDPRRVTNTKPPRRRRRGLRPGIEPIEARLALSTFVVPAGAPSDTFTLPANAPGDDQYNIQGTYGDPPYAYGYNFVISLPAGGTITLANQGPADSGFYIDGVTAPDGSNLLPYDVLPGPGASTTVEATVAGNYTIATDPGGWSGEPFTLVVTVPSAPVVTFTSSASAFPISTQLMSQVPFHVAVSPGSPTPSSYGLQIAGVGVAPQGWTDVAAGISPDLNVTERLAGLFTIRAFAEIGGVRYYSNQKSETVDFPTAKDIVQDGSVIEATHQAWLDTLKFFATNHHKRREEGFWITLDTATGDYGHSPITYGMAVGSHAKEEPEIDLLPSRLQDAYSPASLSGIYVVASFHTHTPAMYVSHKYSRLAGPSDADTKLSESIQIPGLVYDYTEESGYVRGGTPMKANASLFGTPTADARRTPPGTFGA